MIEPALGIGAALAAGFAGSAHCATMCGGIATAAGASFATRGQLPVVAALGFNAARIASYAAVAALLAATAGSAAMALPLPQMALAARLLAALVLAALALRLATGRDLLGAERLGAAVWTRLRPAVRATGRLPPALRPAALGALWGFMPCGLVYSAMLVAATSGSAAAAALTMVAFGVGTLPALVGLTLGAAPLGAVLRRPGTRRLAAALVMAAALWTAGGALLHAGHEHHHHAAGPDVAAGDAH
jgi:sulfite exporter TauE/SafE